MKARHTTSWLVAIVAILAMGTVTQAAVVGVDSALGAYTGVGILDTTSRTWETPASGGTFLLGGDTITVTYIAPYTGYRGGGAIKLFQRIRHNGGIQPVTVTLSGLDTSLTYNLVAYGADRYNNRGTKFEVVGSGLGTKTTTGDTSASFIEGTNYVRFDGLTTGTGSLVLKAMQGEVAQINGFEIQSINPIPTPAALPAGLALLGLVALHRRK